MTSVAVVIPSWNTAPELDRCLAALDAQSDVELEVFVVDNGSEDGSRAVLTSRGIRHAALPSNVGFARAVNLGVASTRAAFVLVLNADCFVAPNSIRLLVDALAGDGRLGGVQPRLLHGRPNAAPRRIYSAGQCLSRAGVAFERGWGELDGDAWAEPAEVFGVSGAACMLRRDLFTHLGGYDERYFAFYEDVDLNARARLGGWRFVYVPEAIAFHVGHAAWGTRRRAQRFNVELTVRNRLATAIKVLPAGGVAACVTLTLRTLALGPLRGNGSAPLAGVGAAMRWLGPLLAERRRLRGGATELLDLWLADSPGAGPDPRAVGAAVNSPNDSVR